MTGWHVVPSYILIYQFCSHIRLLCVIADYIIPKADWTVLCNRIKFNIDCAVMTVMKIECIEKKLFLQCPLS